MMCIRHNRKRAYGLLVALALVISISGVGLVAAEGDGDDLIGQYEASDKVFEKYEIGDKIVYFHQRMIGEAIVEGDYIVYQFDKNTKELLDKKTHWRSGLPEHLPPAATTIAKETAESMVRGKVQFSKLYIISPESDVFPLEPTPENPCWVVTSLDDGNMNVTIIDTVTGEVSGYGVPPPYKGFSLSGPIESDPCRGVWTAWYQNAEDWFNRMRYPTEAVEYPDEYKVRSHIQSTETAMFYEFAHGGSTGFASGCTGGTDFERTYASEIHDWMEGYTKMPFTFIGSCDGMCDVGPSTLSYEFRKGSTEDTVTVGYCSMGTEACSDCWYGYSVRWQAALFNYMSQGQTVREAFNNAMADFPVCLDCIRFAGDEDFGVVPVVKRAAPDYYANFLRMAQWLATQQQANGGIQEAEDNPKAITDNTAESIWTWSCYAELTGDYTTYLQNINDAWDFCYAKPSWEEGSSPTNYYTVYNVGWGLLAEMKYRQVYEGRPEYIDHTWYSQQCAGTLVNYTSATGDTRSALCLGLAAGSLYQYGVNVNSSTYCLRAAELGNSVRQWLEADVSRFASENWAVSGGIAAWGVLNSYFRENSGGDVWAEEFASKMPLNAHDGKNNSYEYGHDGWYAWGYYAVSKVLDGENYFDNYRNIVDYLLNVDGDEDGGIPRGPTYTDNQDFAWVTNIAAFALNLGLLGFSPDITVHPASFDVTLPPNTTYKDIMEIANEGGATLSYDLSEATSHELLYDNGDTMSGAAYSYAGTKRAIKFTPPYYPVGLNTVRVYLGPTLDDVGHEQFAMEVYDDDGAGGAPASLLGTVHTTATNWGWSDVDVSCLEITITDGDFYVAYCQLTTPPECEMLRYDTSPAHNRSWRRTYEEGVWAWRLTPYANYMIRCVVEIAEDYSWLDENPKSGSVEPGDCDPITITIDTTGLFESDYSAEIVISSNDPNRPEVTVPVNVHVAPISNIVQVTTDPGSDYSPAIAQTSDGKMWVVWRSYRSGNSDIWYKTSSDGGNTWSETSQITTDAWSDYAPAITQTSDGKVWVVWQSYRLGNDDIWYKTSSDGGVTWSTASQVTTDPGWDYYPAIAQTADGKVWVVWCSERSGNTDIWYKTSDDGGDAWSEASQITTYSGGDYEPAIIQTLEGEIWVVWQRYGDTWYKTSDDGGTTWSEEATLVEQAYEPAIAQTSDNKLWLAWERNRDIWYQTSNDGGITWSEASQFTRFTGYDWVPTATALSSGELALAWQSDRAVNRDIWYGVIGSMEDINPPPHLDWVENEPRYPTTENTVTVRARASDESGIEDVQLVWWLDSISQANFAMYDDGNHGDWDAGDGIYGIQLGPFPTVGTVVEYQIQIRDVDDNTIIAPQYSRSFEVIEPFVKTADILLVGDQANWVLPYYTGILDILHYAYDIWDTDLRGNIDGETLNQYVDGVVIWAVPYWGYISHSDTQDSLASYLDGGGRLFISGQDIGCYIGDSDFYQQYLHAQYVQDNIGLYALFGAPGDPITDGLYVSISGGDGANNQYYPSEIDPISPAVSIFTYDPDATAPLVEPSVPEEEMRPESGEILPQREPVERPGEEMPPKDYSAGGSAGTKVIESSGSGALGVDTGTYKMVYFAFGFEAINSAADRATVMERVLNWLAPPSITPQANRTLPDSVIVNEQFEVEIDISNAQLGQVVETLPANFAFVTTDGAVQCEVISGMPEGGVSGEITGAGEATFTFFASSATASSFKYSVIAPADVVEDAEFAGVLKVGPEEEYAVGGDSMMDVVEQGPWLYDENDSGYIEIGELLCAISDYIGGDITISQLLEIISLYINHTPKP